MFIQTVLEHFAKIKVIFLDNIQVLIV